MRDDTEAAAPAAKAEAEAADLKAGTEIAGYVIEAKIGEGGMGKVYGARHPRIGKRVAIKVLSKAYCNDASAVARFEQEARLVNEIRHPNIVDVFQFGELPDKRSFFVMESLEGETLSVRIDRAALSTREAIDILDPICDALEAAHEHGVVHRDLKSDNVFLATSRNKVTVKLLDFGIAKLGGTTDLTAAVGNTASGIIVGTPAYMSPEQARGHAVSPRTDVYQLGILTYKMVTGRLPFHAENPFDLIVEQVKTPPPSPKKLAPKTPDVFARLIVQMMAKDAAARPTLKEVRAVFAELRDEKAPAAQSRKSLPKVREEAVEPPPARRSTTVLLGLTLFLVGFISLLVFLWVRDRNSETQPEVPAATAGSNTATTPPPSTPPTTAPTTDTTVTPPPAVDHVEIEIEPPPTTTTPTKKKDKKPKTSKGSDDEPPEVPMVIPSNRPGAILFTLQVASTIEIDGKTVASSSNGGRFEVPPGTHEVRVKAEGRQALTRSVEVLPGGVAIITVEDDTSGKQP